MSNGRSVWKLLIGCVFTLLGLLTLGGLIMGVIDEMEIQLYVWLYPIVFLFVGIGFLHCWWFKESLSADFAGRP